jgi:adenosine deaminase
MSAHPIRRLMNAGVVVTINSDDPAYFGGYVNENYRAVAETFSLQRTELAQLAKNSFEASFLSAPEKQARIAEIEAYASAAG